MKRCNKCGCVNDDTQSFCGQCGNNLNVVPQQINPTFNQQAIPQMQYAPTPQPPKKKRKWWIAIVVLLVICILGSLASLGNSTANEDTSDKPSTSDSANDVTENPNNSKYITLEEFNKIETGMSYDEVKEIIGSDGELLSTSSFNNYSISIYIWYGKGSIGANANVTFTNGKVSGKAQAGLR